MPTTTATGMSLPLNPSQVRSFRRKVRDHYAKHGRDLPWRKRVTPYRVLVSEIMLQQTQVERVITKYAAFLAAFPDFPSLAKAPTPKLLRLWSGMGYNRRALSLRALAQSVVKEHEGRLPSDPDALAALPGIGPYTAGAVAAFAFNRPVLFLDTNIRRVFIFEFFHDRRDIHDDELLPLMRQTLDAKDPRTWYNALMDYGALLKREQGNANRRSAHYIRQSPFAGSNRQVRGGILKLLVDGPALTPSQVVRRSGGDAERVTKNLEQLVREGFLVKQRGRYRVA